MSHKDFCVWLEGFLDACNGEISKEQFSKINEKLNGIKIESKLTPAYRDLVDRTSIKPHHPFLKPYGTDDLKPFQPMVFRCKTSEPTKYYSWNGEIQ